MKPTPAKSVAAAKRDEKRAALLNKIRESEAKFVHVVGVPFATDFYPPAPPEPEAPSASLADQLAALIPMSEAEPTTTAQETPAAPIEVPTPAEATASTAESAPAPEPAAPTAPTWPVEKIMIQIDTPPYGKVTVDLNVTSVIATESGTDSRLRVAVVTMPAGTPPAPSLVEERGQDYALIEALGPVQWETRERDELTAWLTERLRRANRVEAWGDMGARDNLIIRQIHSRRASTAVPTDIRQRDGALRLYYPEAADAELILFKFEGQ